MAKRDVKNYASVLDLDKELIVAQRDKADALSQIILIEPKIKAGTASADEMRLYNNAKQMHNDADIFEQHAALVRPGMEQAENDARQKLKDAQDAAKKQAEIDAGFAKGVKTRTTGETKLTNRQKQTLDIVNSGNTRSGFKQFLEVLNPSGFGWLLGDSDYLDATGKAKDILAGKSTNPNDPEPAGRLRGLSPLEVKRAFETGDIETLKRIFETGDAIDNGELSRKAEIDPNTGLPYVDNNEQVGKNRAAEAFDTEWKINNRPMTPEEYNRRAAEMLTPTTTRSTAKHILGGLQVAAAGGTTMYHLNKEDPSKLPAEEDAFVPERDRPFFAKEVNDRYEASMKPKRSEAEAAQKKRLKSLDAELTPVFGGRSLAGMSPDSIMSEAGRYLKGNPYPAELANDEFRGLVRQALTAHKSGDNEALTTALKMINARAAGKIKGATYQGGLNSDGPLRGFGATFLVPDPDNPGKVSIAVAPRVGAGYGDFDYVSVPGKESKSWSGFTAKYPEYTDKDYLEYFGDEGRAALMAAVDAAKRAEAGAAPGSRKKAYRKIPASGD